MMSSEMIVISLGIGLLTLGLVCGLLLLSQQKLMKKLHTLSENTLNVDRFLQESRQLFDHQQKLLVTELQLNVQNQLLHSTKALHAEHIKSMQFLQDRVQAGMTQTRQQVSEVLQTHNQLLTRSVESLSTTVEKRLFRISEKVEQRLSEGFEKTTMTFTDIMKRLALIDEAQKRITELSVNVVSLQSVLDDKRTRGAFGEVQLGNLIRNMIPETHYAFQYTLSNNCRADCALLLPEPTGCLIIDAKFPLETFRKLQESDASLTKPLQQQFRQDIKKHIVDIASKYIQPPETSDGAIMFIPAEAVFAEIHSAYPDLVEYAQQKRVWLVSPTTLMAVLTTARAVLKDAATRKQVHIIRDHLMKLATDFKRFEKRMDNLAKHIHQANDDVTEVRTSAKKLNARFLKIERVELEEEPNLPR